MTENNDNGLLLAVEALTKPDILTRYTGDAHDHFWSELVRPVTPEERAAAKAEKRKLPRTVGTGVWWCMFCDETRDQKPSGDMTQRIDRHDDPPLLDQLEARVRTSLSDGGAAGSGGASVLVDTSAFALVSRITEKLHTWYTELGASAGNKIPLVQLVRSWYALYLGGHQPVGDDLRRQVILERWVTEIRDLLDPPDQIPYRGQPCPICGETRAIRDLDGEVTDTVALWAVLRPRYREEGSYGLCRACNTVIATSSDPLQLRARMNGAFNPAERLTHTVAEAVTNPGNAQS